MQHTLYWASTSAYQSCGSCTHTCTRTHADSWVRTYMCKHAHTNIHNPDTDDSLCPFANQLYVSQRGESEKRERERQREREREVQQLLVCKQTQSGIIIPSFLLPPMNLWDTTNSQTLTHYGNSNTFSHFYSFFPLCTQPATFFLPSCTRLPSSPHFSSFYLSTC